MFGNTVIGILLFITHLLACIIVGLIFRFWKFKDNNSKNYKTLGSSNKSMVTFSNLGEILSTSIMSAFNTVIMIGGFVILFSVIISILNNSGILDLASSIFYPIFDALHINTDFIKPILSGLVELTNGLNMLTVIPEKSISTIITFASFVLGFGGISVLLQVLSITSKSDISIKPYIIGKFLQGIIAAILTYAFIHIFPIFNLDLTPIFSANVNKLPASSGYFGSYYVVILGLIILLSGLVFIKRKKVY